MQFAGDDEAARQVLASLRCEGAVSLFNVPAGDPLLTAAKALGGQTTLRQREMVIDLPV
jgi:hypothetical protein